VARPSLDLENAEAFWVDGVGLQVLWRAHPEAEGEHALLMIGAPGCQWHLELVEDPATAAAHPPSAEDLLVLYLGAEVPEERVARLEAHGGRRVPARNPYWNRWGVTFLDPDGYRLVLSSRSWE
jgi:hypothetical protein